MSISRREWIQFLGLSAGAVMLEGCMSYAPQKLAYKKIGISPQRNDLLVWDSKIESHVILKAGEPLSENLNFGQHADFNRIFPIPHLENNYILWTNHEAFHRILLHRQDWHVTRHKMNLADAEKEMRSVGGSLTHLVRDSQGKYSLVPNSKYNKRLDALTQIPFSGGIKIRGSGVAQGTLANCAGGQTPWGSVLSCEENYQEFIGERTKNNERIKSATGWEQFFQIEPEHYGWVVEINPMTGDAKKLISLGRFTHEGATVTLSPDGRAVVYMGDDGFDRCIYKFIASQKNSLDEGELFVADTVNGKWISLDRDKNKILKQKYSSQLEVLIHAREAAILVGGTPHDRPEDIQINPKNKDIFISLTGNFTANRPYGSIAKITEKNADCLALEFSFSTFVAGGPKSGLACPDNLAFDHEGHLWVTNDISEKVMWDGDYAEFGNNGLFLIPMHGSRSGEVIQVASAPIDAEMTGPCFIPGRDELIISIQHPGERTSDINNCTSHWPDGGNSLPKSGVVIADLKNWRKSFIR